MPAAACCCLLLPAAACGCLLLPAAPCCCLLLVAAAGGCCCCAAVMWLLLLWCCCRAAAIKQPPKQETTAAAAVPTKTRPCRMGKHHGPEGRTESKICVSEGRNVPSEISYKKLAIRFSMLATGSLLAATLLPLLLLLLIALTATDAAGTLEKKSIGAAAVPTKTRPCRTGKHHGPEGRTESKICVSRGRNVPSEISYKKLAIRFSYTFLIRFSMLATGSLLAAALLPLLLLLLMLLEP